MTQLTGLFAFGLIVLAIGLLVVGGCAATPKKKNGTTIEVIHTNPNTRIA